MLCFSTCTCAQPVWMPDFCACTQARLRALRASLGARAMPGAADPPVRLTSEDTSPLVPQAATAQQDGTLHKFSQRKEVPS